MAAGTVDKLDDVIADIQETVLAISGIKAAPQYSPEAIVELPFSICYPSLGSINTMSAGFKKSKHTLVLQVLFSRAVLPEAIKTSVGYVESIPSEILKDPTLGGNVDTIIGEITYRYGAFDFGPNNERLLGYEFLITVKMETTT